MECYSHALGIQVGLLFVRLLRPRTKKNRKEMWVPKSVRPTRPRATRRPRRSGHTGRDSTGARSRIGSPIARTEPSLYGVYTGGEVSSSELANWRLRIALNHRSEVLVNRRTKLSPSMTLRQFDNGYWYATQLKDFARQSDPVGGQTAEGRARKRRSGPS